MRRRGVTWEETALEPRACVRCHLTKDADGFPVRGPHGNGHRGVTRVCWACVEDEAWGLYRSGFHPRPRRVDWSENGVAWRACARCKKGKPLDREHFQPMTNSVKLTRTCRQCRAEVSNAANRIRRKTPEFRARAAERARRRRAGNPDVKRAEAEARRRWRAKVRADAKRHAELLETERMSRRLRAEREGKPARKYPRGVTIETGPELLPVGPLVALIQSRIEHRQAVDRLLGFDSLPGVVREVCEELAVDERNFYGWKSGERQSVRVGLAERVLSRAGVDWTELWPYDDFAAHFLAEPPIAVLCSVDPNPKETADEC